MKKEGEEHSGCLNCSVCLLFFDFCIGVGIYGLGTARTLKYPYRCGFILGPIHSNEEDIADDEWLHKKIPHFREWKANTVDTGKVCWAVVRPFLTFEILKFIILITYLVLKCIKTKDTVENDNSQNQDTTSPSQNPNYQNQPQTPYYQNQPQAPYYQNQPQASNYQLPPQNENNQNLPQNPDSSVSLINNDTFLEKNDSADDTQPDTAEPL